MGCLMPDKWSEKVSELVWQDTLTTNQKIKSRLEISEGLSPVDFQMK